MLLNPEDQEVLKVKKREFLEERWSGHPNQKWVDSFSLVRGVCELVGAGRAEGVGELARRQNEARDAFIEYRRRVAGACLRLKDKMVGDSADALDAPLALNCSVSCHVPAAMCVVPSRFTCTDDWARFILRVACDRMLVDGLLSQNHPLYRFYAKRNLECMPEHDSPEEVRLLMRACKALVVTRTFAKDWVLAPDAPKAEDAFFECDFLDPALFSVGDCASFALSTLNIFEAFCDMGPSNSDPVLQRAGHVLTSYVGFLATGTACLGEGKKGDHSFALFVHLDLYRAWHSKAPRTQPVCGPLPHIYLADTTELMEVELFGREGEEAKEWPRLLKACSEAGFDGVYHNSHEYFVARKSTDGVAFHDTVATLIPSCVNRVGGQTSTRRFVLVDPVTGKAGVTVKDLVNPQKAAELQLDVVDELGPDEVKVFLRVLEYERPLLPYAHDPKRHEAKAQLIPVLERDLNALLPGGEGRKKLVVHVDTTCLTANLGRFASLLRSQGVVRVECPRVENVRMWVCLVLIYS